MTPIIMNAPGLMHEDKHNRYLTDEELDAILPSSGYAIVTPPPGYAPLVRPPKLSGPSVTEVGGFQIQESSDAAAAAAATTAAFAFAAFVVGAECRSPETGSPVGEPWLPTL